MASLFISGFQLIRPPKGGNFEMFSHKNAQAEHKKYYFVNPPATPMA
jgi:hypothetical protein